MPDSQAAQRLVAGRYRLESILGRGGMGVVWRATDELIGRTVAIKEIRAPVGLPADERRLFGERALREARTAGRINHPAVVAIHDLVPATGDDEAVYIVTELVDAPTLADLLDREGTLPPNRVTAIGIRMLDALKAAHSVGVVHRDVKPGNIMVLPGDEVKLLDFGIAQAAGDARLTRHGMMGSTGYLAPELFHGSDPTPAADLWSAGVTLAQAVNGELPFERASTAATVHAVLYDDIPAVDCDEPLSTVVAGLLTRDVAQRLTVEQARDLLDVPVVAGATGRRDDITPVVSGRPNRSAPEGAGPAPEGEAWERQPTTVQPAGPAPPRQRSSAAGSGTSSTGVSFPVVVPETARRVNVAVRLVLVGLVLWATLLFINVLTTLDVPEWTVIPVFLLPAVAGAWVALKVVDPPHGPLRVDPRSVRMTDARRKPHDLLWEHVASVTVGPGDSSSTVRSRLGIELTRRIPESTLSRARALGVIHEQGDRAPVWMIGDLNLSPAHTVRKLRSVIPSHVRIVGPASEIAGWPSRAFRPLGRRLPVVVLCFALLAALVLSGHLYTHRQQAAMVALADDPVSAVAFSPDGTALASASTETFSITLWNVADHRAMAVIPGHTKKINVLAFSPDGKTLASGGEDGVVKLWDVATRQSASTLAFGETQRVSDVLFTPQGSGIAAVGSGDAKVWPSLSSGKRVDFPDEQRYVEAARFSQDGRVLVTLDRKGSVRAWETASGRSASRIDGPVAPWSEVSADGEVLIHASGSGQILATLVGEAGRPSATAFGPGDLFVTVRWDEIRVWRTTTGRTVHVYKAGFFPTDEWASDVVALSASGAAAVGGDEGLWVWTYGSGS
ncbi:WD40 repeat domain-containing serine/threonine protein kinase [Micromonospora foliorum]|uniref:WD40 repeat domain-containing serine/threonine protein kinase n=1 Tax=Micromonospora foliorum TaxID=2911210 RepID=UPI001EE86C40|nr:serine/threonine-protein kinase [Micromonospora foliorum]MCG5436395.1 serine/threonine-protein kinase [Micromonospora foliorum]